MGTIKLNSDSNNGQLEEGQQIAGSSARFVNYPAAKITQITPIKAPINYIIEFKVIGSYFTPGTIVTFSLGQVLDVFVDSDNQLRIRAISSVAGSPIITFDNGVLPVNNTQVQFVDLNWIDFRSINPQSFSVGTASTSQIQVPSGVTANRSSSGISFVGRTPFQSFAYFRFLTFNRTTNKTIWIIFGNDASNTHVLGLGSELSSSTSTSQQNQFQNGFLFDGDRSLLYKQNYLNRITVNFDIRTQSTRNFRLEISNSGQFNSIYRLFNIGSSLDPQFWSSDAFLITSGVFDVTGNYSALNLFPSICFTGSPNNFVTAIAIF